MSRTQPAQIFILKRWEHAWWLKPVKRPSICQV